MANDIFYKLTSSYTFLTKTERRIADLLLKDPKTFITYSMAELSCKANVSQGSVTNFAKKFCGCGYSEMKLRVAAESAGNNDAFSTIDVSLGVKGAMETKMRDIAASFRNTVEMNDEKSLGKAAELIMKAKRIEIYGVFYSGLAAEDLQSQLIQLGVPASYISDMLLCAVSASLMKKDGLVIAISASGTTKETLDAVENAYKNGVPIIGITSNAESKLASLSDAVLLAAPGGGSLSEINNEIRMAELFVIDALCAYLRGMVDGDGERYFYRLNEITNSHSVDGE